MSISYNNLWKLLDSKGISKTEFRKTAEISTVTLAKLSKNEPLSLSTIESICKKMKCGISDVVDISAQAENEMWSSIEPHEFYSIKLFYININSEAEQSLKYLYGFSVPMQIEMEEHHTWTLTQCLSKNSSSVWMLSNIIKGSNLSAFLKVQDENLIFKDYLTDIGQDISRTNATERNIREQILNMNVLPEGLAYREPFVLIPQSISSSTLEGLQPYHSYCDKLMYCESLVCCNKEEFYKSKEGTPNVEAMETIYELFKQENFLVDGLRDIGRLGNFEVLSYCIDAPEEDKFLTIDTVVDKVDGVKRNIVEYKITVKPEFLKGDYALEVIVYNNNDNPLVYKMFNLYIEGQNVVRRIPVGENTGKIEVKLFDLNQDAQQQIIAWKKYSYMMEISFNMCVASGQVTLEQVFNKKSKNKNKPLVIHQYSSEQSTTGLENRDRWEQAETMVKRDFSRMYGHEASESKWFPVKTGQDEFLEWLRKKINRNNAKSIMLFDPYIDDEALPKIFSLVENTGIVFHIVTVAKEKDNMEWNIRKERMTAILTELGAVIKGKISISVLDAKYGFHDRFLFVEKGNQDIQIFTLSNSLDGVAKKYSSVVTKLDRFAGAMVMEEYKHNYLKAVEAGSVDELQGQKIASVCDNASKNNVEKLLEENDIQGLKERILSQINIFCAHSDRNKSIVVNTDDDSDVRSLLYDMYTSLEFCGRRIGQYDVPFTLTSAINDLATKSFDDYVELFGKIMLEHKNVAGVMIREAFLSAAIENILLSTKESGKKLAGKYMQTQNNLLIALGAAWLIKEKDFAALTKCFADNPEYLSECYRLGVINLEVEDCWKGYRRAAGKKGKIRKTENATNREYFLEQLEMHKRDWVKCMPLGLTSTKLENMLSELATRSVQDVCDIVSMAVEEKKASQQEAVIYLLDHLSLDAKGLSKDTFIRGENFLNAQIYIDTIDSLAWVSGRTDIANAFAALEKKLIRNLYDIFLKDRDYTTWKYSIDTLLWAMTMRNYCRKAWNDYDEIVKTDKNLAVRVKEMRSLVKKNEALLAKYSDAYAIWKQNYGDLV